MSTGEAKIRLLYPDIRIHNYRSNGQHSYSDYSAMRSVMVSHWRVLLNFCRSLRRSKAEYTVEWEFTDDRAVAHIAWVKP